MKKILLIILFSICFVNIGNSQKSMWKETTFEKTSAFEKTERNNIPSNYLLYNLNLESFKALVEKAPRDNSGELSKVVATFPNASGSMDEYIVYEAPVMEDELAAKYPNIKSYVAKGLKDKTATIRFSITTFGLHAMLTSGDEGSFYIDSYTKDFNNYIVYNKKSINNTRTFTCLNQDETTVMADKLLDTKSTLVNDGIFRQYRLAMACTIEYAAFHVNAAGLNSGTLAQKKAAVLSAMVVTMTRVNGIYERDMSLRMNLVGNNDSVIFIDADNFDNSNATTLIGQSQSIIDANIGNSNYDIGHTVSTGGGGLAGLGVVCNNAQKARGITGSPSPVGDPFDIDYVAHEVGHQFGGSHTFNNSCSGNVSTTTSVEPGSGSTIMAYAGICAPNVQSNSDAYFHAISIAQMTTKVLTTSCAASTSNGNFAPVVAPVTSNSIPFGTPFSLTAVATDANNDALTYCWEQTDTAISTQSPVSTSITGPNFRSLTPVSSPTRYFPALATTLAGLPSTWEVLPTVARSMSFAVTVRDNRAPNGGQTNRANTTITFANAGPFDVTSQNTDQLVWAQGSSQTITWAVNGTDSLPGSLNVDILLSTDGGLTYPTILVANTLNDGTQVITAPSINAASCRVMVKPTGNVYFDINTKSFAIGDYTYQQQNSCTDYPFNINAAITESADTSYPGMSLTIADSFLITDANFYANVTHPNIGQFSLLIRAPWQTSLNTAIWYGNAATCTTGVNMNKWFDTAGTAANCANVNSGGPFLPYSTTNINGYNGNNSAGAWLIYFKDTVVDSNVANALFNTFTIQLCKSVYVAVLEVEDFGLTDFALYPNPNNGNFRVQFSSESSNDINVTMHDLRGRQVYAKSFQNNGLFSQDLQLNNASSGIYLVTVQDGNRKEVKKIVVE